MVDVLAKKYNKEEIAEKEKVKTELELENSKLVQTDDVDHFWNAFDELKNCKTRKDSLYVMQTLYFDKTTNGLIMFSYYKNYTAERFINSISRYPKFYASVRKNTIVSKSSEEEIKKIISKFKEIYRNFKEVKFAL